MAFESTSPAIWASGVPTPIRRGPKLWSDYQSAHPEKAAELQAMFAGRLPEGWDKDIPVFEASEKGDATRNSGGKVLNAIAKNIPFMIGGSADLAPSNKSNLTFAGAGEFLPGHYGGRNLHFGIREHAMAGIVNGLSLSGLRAYGATFFVFTDYMRGAMRLACIMRQPVLYILTHDSIGVGEDGPTHQPVEHLSACRAIPGLYVFRPGDANEVAECYRTAMQIDDHPCAFVLSRQNMETLDRTKYAAASNCAKGGYVLSDCDGKPDVILMGSGSELGLCTVAAEATLGRRHEGASRQHALHGPVRRAEPGVPGRSPAAGSHQSSRRRSRHPNELGPLARPRRQVRRHERLWCQRPVRGGLRTLRHHRRRGRQSRQGVTDSQRRSPRAWW